MKNTYIPLEDLWQMFRRKKSCQKAQIWFTPQEHLDEDTHKSSSRLYLFWRSYSLRTASETSKTGFLATQGCKPWQGSITPLTIYALSDVGQKTAGDGYRRQSDGKLKFDHKLPKLSVAYMAYMFIKKSSNTSVWLVICPPQVCQVLVASLSLEKDNHQTFNK